MANTQARAHVVGPVPIANRDLSEMENCQSSNDHHNEQQLLSRKEKRKRKKRETPHEPFIPPEVEAPAKLDHRIDEGEQLPDDESDDIPHLSRKELRRNQTQVAQTPDSAFSKPFQKSKLPTSSSESRTTKFSIPLALTPPSMPPANYFPLLVCSLGNPGPQYANTLHSAGHTILQAIRDKGFYQPFTKGMSGLVSTPEQTKYKLHLLWGKVKDANAQLGPGDDNFTLWQSTKLMNVSGPGVRSAWKTFAAQQHAHGLEGRLVIVHDELESALGNVGLKDGAASARGHNGIKSCQAALGNLKFWRVGVGIGRPESRDASVVSKYVLRKMTGQEGSAMERASKDVLKALRMVAEGKV